MICNYCGEPSATDRHPACEVAEAEHEVYMLHSKARDIARECYVERDWSETTASRALSRAIEAAEERLRDAEAAASCRP